MNIVFSKLPSVILVLALMMNALPMQSAQAAGGSGSGVINLTTMGNPYTQNFDTLANTGTTNTLAINGWFLDEAGTSSVANGQYAGGTGSSNTGDTYSFGSAASSERALGGLLSGTLTPTIGALFTNNTGSTITSLAIAYTGEQWRIGNTAAARDDRLDFQYSLDATSLTTGSWISVSALNFTNLVKTAASVGTLDGNLAANRAAVGFTIIDLNIPNGTNLWIRWQDLNASGADDGLAVDDFSLTPQGAVTNPTVDLSVDTNSASETGATAVTVTATVSSTVTSDETVDLGVDGAGITAGDYTLSNTVITIPNGSTTGSVTFTVVDDTDVEGTETATLTISNPSAGISLGAITSQNITITDNDAVPVGPSITTQPQGQAIFSGETATLSVVASGTEPLSYQWYQGNTGETSTPVGTNSPSFTTPTLSANTSYWVRVSNSVSSVDSDTATVIVSSVCAQAFTPLYQIQGSGLAAAVTGTVTTQGVVVGDFEGTAAASGFYLQDLTGDGDAATSDGIFVYTGSSDLVSVGQVVRVSGFARERFNQTTLNGSNSNTAAVTAANIVQCGTGSVAPTDVTLPFANPDFPERYEGMLVRFPQSLVIAEYFNYDRFGEIVLAQPLAGETRPYTGTAIDAPGAPANDRTLANSLSRITLDDAQSAQNPPTLRHPNGLPFSLSNLFRGGDLVTNAIGVLGYDFSLYRIVPTAPADYTAANPRPAAPEPVGGTIQVAAMNTLNFFVTADYPTGDALDNKCGPLNNVECRGWDSDQADELTRQRTKLLAALTGLDADVIGLNELENSTGVEPLDSIVSGLSGYAYINTGTIGTDAIKVGMIYRPAVVTPVGAFKLLTTAVDPRFLDTKSRPSLAQTFQVNATGARFTMVVNHFKSKGSACDDVSDPDLLDGQGNCSQTRRAAAKALVDWLATDPTGSGDPDFIIMGDLNSYAKEDTITEILAGADDTAGTSDDFTNLIAHFQGAYAYSYTFDGQAGYLDHALASASLFSQVAGAEDWHINSDETDVLDYDTSFKPAAQDALYEPNANRTSDHDPVIVGLNLTVPNDAPTAGTIANVLVRQSAAPTTVNLYDIFQDAETADADLVYTVSGNTNPALFSSVQIVGGQLSLTYDQTKFGTSTITVKAEDPGLLFAETTFTVTVNYTLQLLHASDWEAGLAAIQDAPNFAAVVDYFDNSFSNTLILSSGDNYIPGTFFNAGGDPALNAVLGVASVGRADMEVLNRIGVEASAFGNHDFDAGTKEVSNIIVASGTWRGAQFPYLSSNLTFTTDGNLSSLNRAGGLETSTIKGKVAPSAIITKNGEKIGLVGITTPLLANISSPGSVGVSPSNPEDMAALAAIVQPAIDSLIAGGANKIIVMAHMQQISYEQALAPLLHGVDIIMAGGSNTLLADASDRLRTGDTADNTYPLSLTNADGDPVLIVNTDGNYRYVGRLVIEFNAAGKLLPGSYVVAESGAYATDNQGVLDLWGNLTDPFATGTKGAAVKQVTDAVASVINAKDAVIYGHANVYLNGLRAEVRTEETNLGNLSADANLAQAKLTDPTAAISIKNGGGIRDSIGSTEDVFDAYGNVIGVNRVKTVANPAAGKNAGDISKLDIENSLRFNNDLSMITVSAANLKRILEHSVAATTATGTPGQFPQIGGIAFSFDRTKQAQVLAGNTTTGVATVTTEGQRIRNVALIDENGLVIEKIVENGVVVGDPDRLFRIVTLRFLVANSGNGLGGDNYPFPTFGTNRVDMGIFEQTAFSNYLTAKYPLSAPAYNIADSPATLDTRIQNLTLRSDTIFTNVAPWALTLQNTVTTLPENSATASAIKLADIVVSDDALGVNVLSLSGPDASVFELSGNALYLKAGTVLDFETKSSYAVTVNVDDATIGSTPDASVNYTLSLTNSNDAPSSVNAGGPYSANEGGSVLVTGMGSDPDNDTLIYTWDLDNNGSFETSGQSVSFVVGSLDGPAGYTIKVKATDPGNLSVEASATVNVVNVAPTATLVTPAPVNEGANFVISLGSAIDPSAADTLAGFTYAFDCGSGYGGLGSSNTATCVAADNPGVTVKAKIQDKDGGFTEYTAMVVIDNVAPVVGPITAPASPVKVGTTVNTSASFTDVGKLDTHSAVWNWGDGSTSNGIVTEANGSGSVTGSHSYATAGFYTVSLTVTDKDNSTHQTTYQTIIVYNPNGGYVTASGWYYSSAGAYLEKPTKKGLALTTFAVAYPRNASKPSGYFEFTFPAGNLRFEASSFDWLIVDQAAKTAQFQGSGKINRQGTYKFIVWANGNKPNSFRIKIWKLDGTVVYDNGTPSGMGGAIIIHR